MRVVAIDPARIRARHLWFIGYSDAMVERLGAPAIAFRDGLRHEVPNSAHLPFERLHQNLLASHLAGCLLYGPLEYDHAVATLREIGWVTRENIEPLTDMFADLVVREPTADRKEFASVAVNLLVWRLSVRIATQVPLARIEEELATLWGDVDPAILMDEAIASAALPAPPTPEHDEIEDEITVLSSDERFQRIFKRRLTEYDPHAWSHPDLPQLIRRWATVSLIIALSDEFSSERVRRRCVETQVATAEWLRGLTGAEATLAMPKTLTDSETPASS